MVTFSAVTAFFSKNLSSFTDAVMQSGKQCAEYMLSVASVIVVFCGIMNVANKAGFCNALSKLLRPVLKPAFGDKPDTVYRDITMNISCNVLGLGNAATPYGINAAKALANGPRATDELILFTVINSSSLQIIPTTVAAIRQSAGAKDPFDVIFCIWICSALSLAVAVSCCKLCKRWSKGCKTQ